LKKGCTGFGSAPTPITTKWYIEGGGKGGGAHAFAQGGGLEESRLEEALSFAEDLLG
jgi:alanyl-tRNA synthetase